MAMAAALELDEARRTGDPKAMERVQQRMQQLFQHQYTNHKLAKFDVPNPTESSTSTEKVEGLVPGQRVRIVALIDPATDRPSPYNNQLATIKSQLTSRRNPQDNSFTVIVDGAEGVHLHVAARNLAWGKDLGQLRSLGSNSRQSAAKQTATQVCFSCCVLRFTNA